MNWVNKYKLLVIEMVKYNSLKINDLWYVLHSSFNMAQDQCIDEDVLNEISPFMTSLWNTFSEEKFTSTIVKCNISSTPSPDKLAW